MFALRTVARTQVRSVRAGPVSAMRSYSDKHRPEGTTGSSSGFKNREQAEEGAYAKRQEAAQLAKLKEQLASSEQEKAKLQEQLKSLQEKQQ